MHLRTVILDGDKGAQRFCDQRWSQNLTSLFGDGHKTSFCDQFCDQQNTPKNTYRNGGFAGSCCFTTRGTTKKAKFQEILYYYCTFYSVDVLLRGVFVFYRSGSGHKTGQNLKESKFTNDYSEIPRSFGGHKTSLQWSQNLQSLRAANGICHPFEPSKRATRASAELTSAELSRSQSAAELRAQLLGICGPFRSVDAVAYLQPIPSQHNPVRAQQ